MSAHTMILKGLPIPPSSNHQYKSFMRYGKIRHVSSPELVAFKKEMEFYWIENADLLKFAREAFAGMPLSIHASFALEKSRVLTKKGHFKRLDVSNRLKSLHDCIAKALLIDDSAFVRISAEKYAVGHKKMESVTVTIALCDFVEHGSLL